MPGKDREYEAEPILQPRYVTLEDVAIYLSVSVPQVYALVRSGALPAVKIGGRGIWRVDRHKLDEYLDRLEEDTREWAKAHPLNRSEAADADDEPRAKKSRSSRKA